jgi:hypothetical protein
MNLKNKSTREFRLHLAVKGLKARIDLNLCTSDYRLLLNLITIFY